MARQEILVMCQAGSHKSCGGFIPVRKGSYGGTVCACPCHSKIKKKKTRKAAHLKKKG